MEIAEMAEKRIGVTPTSIVHFFRREIFPAVLGIYSTLPGKNLELHTDGHLAVWPVSVNTGIGRSVFRSEFRF